MRNVNTDGLLIIATVLLAALSLSSCADNTLPAPSWSERGKPATVTLEVAIPVMDDKTRASLDDGSLNMVENLWVRTYSAATGEATSKWVVLEPGTTDTEIPHELVIDTESGESYIVGVANVDNLGATVSDLSDRHPLKELLEKADKWEDFLSIVVASPSGFGDVYAPAAPLPMAGCYVPIAPGAMHYSLAEWQDKDFIPVNIPAGNSGMKGAIHLRRLVSHVTFNVIAGSDDFNLTVNSYRVMNAPRYSWLYERGADKDSNRVANVGDLAHSEEDAAYYYADVPQYGSQYITQGSVMADGKKKECLTFDFWQGENKHTGTSGSYGERDAYTDNGGTVLFTSLTGNSWTPNNEASYVLVNCSLTYNDEIKVDGEGAIVKEEGGTPVYRTAQATYIIHLGYTEGTDAAEKSKDFNCFRNVDYTYNVTVNGVDDIRVDAFADENKPEKYNGEEGLVSDLQYATIELDAHYHAFNIYLTEEELSDPEFGFIITAYEDGNQITITDENEQSVVDGKRVIYALGSKEVIPEKYYNWIEMRPTTSKERLAVYKPRFGGKDNNDGATFLMSDLKGDKVTRKGPWDCVMKEEWKSKEGYYTVFVNEYTYEPMYEGDDGYADESLKKAGEKPNWMGYVNQNPRRFYVRVTRSTSPDGKSIYSRSKYGISQNSIQTYYSDQIFTGTGTAIGLERVNETEGLNMRSVYGGGSDANNGRWNVAQYLSGQERTVKTLKINEGPRPLWETFIDQTEPLQIPEVEKGRLQNGPPLPERSIDSQNGPVRLPKFVTYKDNKTPAYNDPQDSEDGNYYVEVMNACTNRNRDNNGNGRIDPEELRWYVPAMGKYLRMILGSSSLGNTPVMNFSQVVPGLPKSKNKNEWSDDGTIQNGQCTRYFFAGSNYFSSGNVQVLWGMEGLSTSGWGQWSGSPWQVRCIRNLGTNLNTVTEGEKVVVAYVRSGNTVRMTYYDNSSIRANRYSGNGTDRGEMPVHVSTSPYNMVYKAFEFATADLDMSDDENKPTDWTVSTTPAYINGNPCSKSGEGWRVPNQKELTIMRNLGVFSGGAYDFWLSCTANYFNGVTGLGGDANYVANQNYLMAVSPSKGLMLTPQNYSATIRIRCVRDID